MLIYVLDDDEIELELWLIHSSSINASGKKDIKCVAFSSFELLKQRCSLEVPDVFVIDLIMPLQPGTEVCSWVVRNYPNIPLFINTGLTGDEFKVLADSYKAQYICKETAVEKRLEVVINAG